MDHTLLLFDTVEGFADLLEDRFSIRRAVGMQVVPLSLKEKKCVAGNAPHAPGHLGHIGAYMPQSNHSQLQETGSKIIYIWDSYGAPAPGQPLRMVRWGNLGSPKPLPFRCHEPTAWCFRCTGPSLSPSPFFFGLKNIFSQS